MALRLMVLFALLSASASFATPYDTPLRLVVQRDNADADAGVDLVHDCYIWEESPSYNGNGSTLYTGLVGTTDKMAFLWFDVSAVPAGADVLGAQVLLHSTGGAGIEVTAHHVTKPWAESEPTWATFGTAFEPDAVSSFTPRATGPTLFDVTNAVQQWVTGQKPNNGLVLMQATMTSASTYAGSEVAAQSQRPMLEVWYLVKSPLVHSTPSAALEASCSVELRYGLAAHTPAATAYSVTGAPEGLSLDATTGELTWTPVRSQTGSHELTVNVTDAHGRSSELPVTIDVSCPEPLAVGCTAVPVDALSPVLLLLFALRRRR